VQSSSQIITTNKPTSSFLQAGCPSCHPINSAKALYHILIPKSTSFTNVGDVFRVLQAVYSTNLIQSQSLLFELSCLYPDIQQVMT